MSYMLEDYLIRINFGAEKIWRNWRKMAKIAKLNPWRKNFFSNKKIEICFHTVCFQFAFFLTEFLVCSTKQRFLSMFMIILSLEEKVKKTQIKY